MPTEWTKSPWDTSYTFTTPGYANYASTRTAGAPGYAGTYSLGAGVPHAALAQQTNQFMTGQAVAPFVANLPNYASMVGKRTENIGSNLSGQVPQDVITQLLQGGAERGIATGSPGSPNSNAAYLRSLGLTSLGLQEQGSKDLSQAISDTPVPQLFNPASLFVPEMLAQQQLSAAGAGLNRGGGGTGLPSSIQLPGGRLGQGNTNPPYGTVGAGAPSGPSMGSGSSATMVGGHPMEMDEIARIASGQVYSNWWNTYGSPGGSGANEPALNPQNVPFGFSSWDEANAFSDELASDTSAAYSAYYE